MQGLKIQTMSGRLAWRPVVGQDKQTDGAAIECAQGPDTNGGAMRDARAQMALSCPLNRSTAAEDVPLIKEA